MSKLCNYIIIHTQNTPGYISIFLKTIYVRTPEVVTDGLAVVHDVHQVLGLDRLSVLYKKSDRGYLF